MQFNRINYTVDLCCSFLRAGCLAVVGLFWLTGNAVADDWPQWMG